MPKKTKPYAVFLLYCFNGGVWNTVLSSHEWLVSSTLIVARNGHRING